MDFEVELNRVIKEKEKEKEGILEYIATLKMQLNQFKSAQEELIKNGINVPVDISSVIAKLENININTLETITADDLNLLNEAYIKSKEYKELIEREIVKELGIELKEEVELKGIEVGLKIETKDSNISNSNKFDGGLFDGLLM
ncbi:hypothetical protein [Clostridium tertium]|uniref:hypothetical protein n=1 Tax=Clostridium tertium TaxID=1559 RepID=UPI0023B34423|nr:hypothetical protein [Clostridium tertium]